MPPGILIFERHAAMRSCTRAYLENAGFQVCAETGDDKEAVAKSIALQPDLVIMDLHGGFELIPALLKCSPSLKVLIFTLCEGSEFVRLARVYGAHGYVLKSDVTSLTAEVRRLLST